LRVVAAELIGLTAAQARHSRVEVIADIEDGLSPIQISSAALGQVLLNLVLNAIQAMPGGGKVLLAAEAGPPYPRPPAKATGDVRVARITVSDTGPGIPAEMRERVFDPFFTTKRGGTGLGLAICERIIHAFRGTIELEASAVTGARFVMELPFAPPESEIP
jgi:signal transduction histidine kinase